MFAFHRYYGLQYPALVDPSSQPGSFSTQGAAGPVTNAYQVAAYPTFYIIDPHGKDRVEQRRRAARRPPAPRAREGSTTMIDPLAADQRPTASLIAKDASS